MKKSGLLLREEEHIPFKPKITPYAYLLLLASVVPIFFEDGWLVVITCIFLFTLNLILINNVALNQIVTNQRIIKYHLRILFPDPIWIELNDVKSIDIKQDTLGKILNYGKLIIEGQNNLVFTFDLVLDPKRTKQRIEKLLKDQGIQIQ